VKLQPGDVAVITGGASGIGYAVAEALAERGLGLVLADIEQETVERAAAELGAGHRVVDIRHLAEVKALADGVVEEFGHVDLVFNNAGVVGRRALLWEQDESDWRWVTEVNYFGVMNGVRSFVPHMVEAGRGHVVNTASIHGLALAGGGHGPYSASKHAVVGLTEQLRFELDRVAPEIGVTVLCPGAVESRLSDAARNRPAEHGSPAAAVSVWDAAFDRGLRRVTAREVAPAILDGIEADLLYLPVAPQVVELARERVEHVLGDLAAAEALAPQWVD
jgi:NAD(P)-dependent dehydrogenase (short-subunit alcohol dehydrogenase family)